MLQNKREKFYAEEKQIPTKIIYGQIFTTVDIVHLHW